MASVDHTEDLYTPFRRLKSKAVRQDESAKLMAADTARIPVIVEMASTEKFLPMLEKKKFLIPKDAPLSQLHFTLRQRLQLHSDQSFFLLIDGRHMPTMSSTMCEVYDRHKADDGFLYVTYASQEVFG